MALSSTPVPGIMTHLNIHGKDGVFNAGFCVNGRKSVPPTVRTPKNPVRKLKIRAQRSILSTIFYSAIKTKTQEKTKKD